ncbi:MAG: ABC transporter ATP-binding protein [Acidimicrobiia bacterium]|nr:ABC transporter ATP-binding protein [Acidimicrobiia bacterium]
MASAISIKGVSKKFTLSSEKHQTLKERVIHIGRGTHDDFWALNDISIEVEEGTTFGLIGHNGSGKSTLLKLIGGILQPTSGEIITHGRIAALLELGAGMQPDLTGRENIFLNGSILGLSKKELAKRFDEIVEFSELEKFIDTQVRFYSSGMYVRLGFAVAVNVDPDILLVDEVLAVGDELFQRKCLERVKQFQREGRTIIVVTHSVDQIRAIGTSCAVLDHGNLIFTGEPTDAIREFRERLFVGDKPTAEIVNEDPEIAKSDDADGVVIVNGVIADEASIHHKKIRITGAGFSNPKDAETNKIRTGGALQAQISWETTVPVDNVNFSFEVYDSYGALVFEANTQDNPSGVLDGHGNVWFSWKEIPLADGTYRANVGITSHDGGVVYDWLEAKYDFEVTNDFKTLGLLHIPVQSEISIVKSNGELANG